MSITPEQVADLQPGDVVELECHEHPGTVITGPLHVVEKRLQVGTYIVRTEEGGQFFPFQADRTLTVVSRVPRPLYVNHPRTEAVPGDVVAPPDDDDVLPGWRPAWARTAEGNWIGTHTGRPIAGEMLDRLRLLVDGETGQVVP